MFSVTVPSSRNDTTGVWSKRWQLRPYGNDVISEQLLLLVQAADHGAHVFLTGRDHFLDLADDHFVQTLLFFLCIHFQ